MHCVCTHTKLFVWYLHYVANMASDRMHKMSIIINSLGCDASLLWSTCSWRSGRRCGSEKTLLLIVVMYSYVLDIVPAIMILTRKAKWLAVPVIIRTILPLAVHFARRFFANHQWISAAGLLEALSFPSRDRNFDYFPDHRLTSKRSVFSSVDEYGRGRGRGYGHEFGCGCSCRCRCRVSTLHGALTFVSDALFVVSPQRRPTRRDGEKRGRG